MTTETVNAQTTEGHAVSFQYDFGDNIAEANHLFGEDVVWAYAKRALVIAAQGYARGLLKSAKSVEDIQTAFDTWKPGAPRAKQSSEDKARNLWASMTPDERANLLKEFQGEAAPEVQPRAKRGSHNAQHDAA